MQKDDLVIYLEDKEKLSYLIHEFGKEGYEREAALILVDLFGVYPKEIYMGKVNDESHPILLYGMFFCEGEKTYEFELMRKDLTFRFRESCDDYSDSVQVIKITITSKGEGEKLSWEEMMIYILI